MDASLILMVWLSPNFPIGAFAYSHGLEWAVEAGHVKNQRDLLGWLEDLMVHGSLPNDLILLNASARAAQLRDKASLRDLNDLALALAPSLERRLESALQGTAFLSAISVSWPQDFLQSAFETREVAYPVAFGLACGCHQLDLAEVNPAFALGFIANQVSAALRLSIIGQTGGQQVTAALLPKLRPLAQRALDRNLDHIGSCTWGADIAAMRHETQYCRLFRS